jgi:hypothetical protein
MNILPLVQLWTKSDEGNCNYKNVDVHSRCMLCVCLPIVLCHRLLPRDVFTWRVPAIASRPIPFLLLQHSIIYRLTTFTISFETNIVLRNHKRRLDIRHLLWRNYGIFETQLVNYLTHHQGQHRSTAARHLLSLFICNVFSLCNHNQFVSHTTHFFIFKPVVFLRRVQTETRLSYYIP